MKHLKLFEEFTNIGPATDGESYSSIEDENGNFSKFTELVQQIEDMYTWSYVEQEGQNAVRFDWKNGQLSFWLNSDLTGEGDLPTRIKDKILDLGIQIKINESKLLKRK